MSTTTRSRLRRLAAISLTGSLVMRWLLLAAPPALASPTTGPAGSAATVLAATDLISGSRAFYSIAVTVLVVLVLVAGGFRAVAAFLGGRMGHAVGWALVGVIVAVIVGSSYAIYVSTKRTVDQTGITTGQFGQ